MDINKLRTSVFEKTGIKVDTDDPIFALVALNDAVLSECVEPHVAMLHQAVEALKSQTEELAEAGARYNDLLQQGTASDETGRPVPTGIAAGGAESDSSNSGVSRNLTVMQLMVGAGGVACLSAALTLGGGWLLRKDIPAPPVTKKIAATPLPPLTPDQIQMIANGEKYAKMWPKLDATTQARIMNIIQEP